MKAVAFISQTPNQGAIYCVRSGRNCRTHRRRCLDAQAEGSAFRIDGLREHVDVVVPNAGCWNSGFVVYSLVCTGSLRQQLLCWDAEKYNQQGNAGDNESSLAKIAVVPFCFTGDVADLIPSSCVHMFLSLELRSSSKTVPAAILVSRSQAHLLLVDYAGSVLPDDIAVGKNRLS